MIFNLILKIAAGMSRDFNVVFLAIYQASEDSPEQVSPRIKQFRHDLEVITETDKILLPIEAEIATAEHYREMYRGNLEAGKSNTVRILSVRPASTKEVLTKPFLIS